MKLYQNSFGNRLKLQPGMYLHGQGQANPAFSICIPTFARAELLMEAVYSAINQDFHGTWEVIVCENSSDEQTLHMIRVLDHPRVRLWRNENNIAR